jgi:hypothetical protein
MVFVPDGKLVPCGTKSAFCVNRPEVSKTGLIKCNLLTVKGLFTQITNFASNCHTAQESLTQGVSLRTAKK